MNSRQLNITIVVLAALTVLSKFLNAQADISYENSLDLQKKYLGVIPQKGNLDLTLEQFSHIGVVRDTIIDKSDTSLFYFRGYSTIFNPFSFNVAKIECQIRQSKVYGHDHKSVIDTALSIQIIGVLSHSDSQQNIILSEFKKIRKELLKNHKIIIHTKSKKKKKDSYETISFFPYPLNREVLYNSIIISYGDYYQETAKDSIAITFVYKSGN